MALIKCKECGKEISDQATTCPNCGAKTESANNSINWFGVIIGIILFIGGLCLMLDGMNGSSSNDNRLKYDEDNDTYTYTIWEDESFKNNDDVIWLEP